MIDPITSSTAAAMASAAEPQRAQGTSATSFAGWIGQGLESVNQQLLVGETDLQALAQGNVANLHQVMIRLEESRIAFQTLMQVRTRLLDAYQDIARMQV